MTVAFGEALSPNKSIFSHLVWTVTIISASTFQPETVFKAKPSLLREFIAETCDFLHCELFSATIWSCYFSNESSSKWYLEVKNPFSNPQPSNRADVIWFSSSSHKGGPTPVPPTPSGRPAKRKVVETEPEPPFTEGPDSVRSLELLVTVNGDYCKYTCKTDAVHFKDTLMFQTRIYE